MSDSEDDSSNEMDVDNTGKIKARKKRIRQYEKSHKGPFVVYIRVIDEHTPLKPIKLTKFIFGTCKSSVVVHQVNANKMRVTFSPKCSSNDSCDEARREANALPLSDINKKYRIYIPERLVEVMGCISYSSQESISDLITNGEGKFDNTHLPRVKILDAIRFMKKPDDANNTNLVKTNVVCVTFAGLVLPERVDIYGLLIPTREFKRRQMFCEQCLSYNHTKSHCNNKPRQGISTACIQCQGDHPSGAKSCPRRIYLEKIGNEKEKTEQRKTYAEMLQLYDPSSLMPGENNDDHPPLNLGTRKERAQKRNLDETSNKHASNFKKRKTADNVENDATPPPGFQSPDNCEEDEITSFINSILNALELPPFIMQLVNKFLTPVVHKLISKFTNSLARKVSSLVK